MCESIGLKNYFNLASSLHMGEDFPCGHDPNGQLPQHASISISFCHL
jgi:hypothetical protein